jgi:hypothetical protein
MVHMFFSKKVLNGDFIIFFSLIEFLSSYPKVMYIHFILAANSLTTQMIPVCQNGEGLLGAILEEGIEYKDVVRIVADLFIGAGDTVSD